MVTVLSLAVAGVRRRQFSVCQGHRRFGSQAESNALSDGGGVAQSSPARIFKYKGMFVALLMFVTGAGPGFVEVVLPLAISFYTFIQIAYLMDEVTRLPCRGH